MEVRTKVAEALQAWRDARRALDALERTSPDYMRRTADVERARDAYHEAERAARESDGRRSEFAALAEAA